MAREGKIAAIAAPSNSVKKNVAIIAAISAVIFIIYYIKKGYDNGSAEGNRRGTRGNEDTANISSRDSAQSENIIQGFQTT